LKKAYLDANILLAKAAGPQKEPDQFPLAEKIFNQIKNGEFEAVISSLTLMEVIAVLRTQKGREKEKLDGLTRDKQLEYVHKESKSMYDNIIGELLQLPYVKFDLGGRTDMKKLFDMAFDIMLETKGKVRFYQNCKRCDSKNVLYSSYKGLGSDDIIHALFAKDVGCDLFLTFDGDFDELKRNEKIIPLEIRVIRWEKS
jgi:predicted nucleic acid-binding protein